MTQPVDFQARRARAEVLKGIEACLRLPELDEFMRGFLWSLVSMYECCFFAGEPPHPLVTAARQRLNVLEADELPDRAS